MFAVSHLDWCIYNRANLDRAQQQIVLDSAHRKWLAWCLRYVCNGLLATDVHMFGLSLTVSIVASMS